VVRVTPASRPAEAASESDRAAESAGRSGCDADPGERSDPEVFGCVADTRGTMPDASKEGPRSEKKLVDLLSDDYAWEILVHTRNEAKSVDALSDACDADPSTIYRRVERLQNVDLLSDEQELDPDGHHYKVYTANLDAVHVTLDDDGFVVDVERREAPADRFTRLYEGFK
jgi:hypothetical protein